VFFFLWCGGGGGGGGGMWQCIVTPCIETYTVVIFGIQPLPDL